MAIEFSIPNDFFNDDEREKLTELFGTADDNEFNGALQKIVKSALKEYTDMFLGLGLPSRADEIRQHRLHHLIKNYFETRLPTEAEISTFFQITQSRSKSLLQQTITRFHFDLENEINETLRAVLESAEFDEDHHYHILDIQSDNVLDELNRIVAIKAPRLDPIRKMRRMSRTYQISEDTFDVLANSLGLDING